MSLTADSFSPISHGVADEYGHVLKEGYSSIRDGVPQAEPHGRKVVVVGWCGDIQDLVDSLNMFAPGKTIVTVLCDCCPEVSYGQLYAESRVRPEAMFMDCQPCL